jgi:nitrogen fixation protein NifU and related proteins
MSPFDKSKIPDPMNGMEDLYREIILEHFKSPHNKGIDSSAGIRGEGTNPLCGDSVTLGINLQGEKIQAIKFDGHGCAISQSSCSMMTDAIQGKTVKDAETLAKRFKAVFGVSDRGDSPQKLTPDELGELASLEGVKKFPVRIKCAILPWNTLLETLKKINGI